MGKKIILPGLALLGGALGFGLRRRQWAVEYDTVTHLFHCDHPITMNLALLGVGLALLMLVLLLWVRPNEADGRVFHCASPIYVGAMVAAGLLFFIGGAMTLLEGLDQLALWQRHPEVHVFTYPAALLAGGVLAFLSGLATLILGRSSYQGSSPALLPFWVCFPPLSALVWVFSFHLDHGTDPVLMAYGVSLAAAVCLLLAHYHIAAFFHDRPAPRRLAFAALMGTALGLVSLADGLPRFHLMLTFAFLLSALANTWAMLCNASGQKAKP